MQNTSSLLAQRFRDVILHGTWIANTNFKNELENLNFEIANTKISSLNTIAVLAQHIHYYVKGVNDAFKGLELTIKDQYSFDFKPITSQNQWNEFLNTFWGVYQKYSLEKICNDS